MSDLKMHSVDKVKENIDKISMIFPDCVTEAMVNNELTKVIDFDLLKQYLSSYVVEGNDERYQFAWPDKKNSILLANTPIAKTLRPYEEESVDFTRTGNLYIEGDNLDALKLLQETYLGKVKMIYIDPPYNTGNDLVYTDDFFQSINNYIELSGQFDKEGNRLFQNTESNGRFHTDWLNMIYPRIKVSQDLLTDDGAIFISINDNENANLKKICDEIFGAHNFVSQFIWKSKLGKVGTTATVSTAHEYILCYAKNLNLIKFKMIENQNNGRKENLRQWGQADRRKDRPSMYYPITINGKVIYPIKDDGTEGRWRVGKDVAKELLNENLLELIEKDGKFNIYRNFEAGISITPYDTLLPEKLGTTANGSLTLKALDLNKIFDYSKPIELIKFFIYLITNDDDIIMDYFSGSATTAHAVMKLNAEDGGNRKFIMVQLPEETDEKSEAYKAGYKNICEIGKERIRRAGKKIKEEAGLAAQNLDLGFRVLKVDSTNMKDVYYKPEEYKPRLFDELEDNIKVDRTPLDLLFQVMLEMDVLLSSKIEEKEISGKKVFSVMDDYLIACFDKGISKEVVEAIAKKRPYYAVFRDSCMEDDSTMTSFEQIFDAYSKETIRKIL